MTQTYVEFVFQLANGRTKTIRVRDVSESADDTAIMSLANLIIQKNSQSNGSLFTELKKCSKFTLEETSIS